MLQGTETPRAARRLARPRTIPSPLRRFRPSPLLLAFASVFVLGPGEHLAAQSAESDSTSEARVEEVEAEGLYTEEQAERGREIFRDRCSVCHLSGQFRGSTFWFRWQGRRVLDLVDQLRATMPQDNPGGLSSRQYVDVVAYLFRLNRLPAGEEELPAQDARLRVIRIPEKESDP